MEEKEITEAKKDSVKISDEVVAVITGVAASETEGVYSVGTGSLAANWTEIISGKKNNAKGIKITMGEASVSIEIQLTVKYGVRITDVAAAVQENVKSSVEEMTGFGVEKVDVKVVGIKSEQTKPDVKANEKEDGEKA